MRTNTAFFQLLRLASPSLPVGAYCYSQGLESALEQGLVHDQSSARGWLGDVLGGPVAHFDAPLVGCAWRASEAGDLTQLLELNAEYLASRECGEQRREALQMGYSLRVLLDALPEGALAAWPAGTELGFAVVWAIAARCLGVKERAAIAAWLFCWLENQLLVLMKALPLGHTAAQQVLSALLPTIEASTEIAVALPRGAWSNFAPMLSMVAMRHETQYSRLFRS
jgi:urease accessory protein